MDKGGALSLLKQAAQTLAAGKPIEDPSLPPMIQVTIPVHVANYLITAYNSIQGGADANTAFGFPASRGQPPKPHRDAVIAIEVDLLNIKGMSLENAIAEITNKYSLESEDTTRSAYKNGSDAAKHYHTVRADFGPEIAAELLEFHREKMEAMKKTR